jgi:hypothetical protein
MPNIAQTLGLIQKFTTDNSPLLLTSVGVVGAISTAILTGKATVKAVRRADEVLRADMRDEFGSEYPVDENPEDMRWVKSALVKEVWTLYIPPLSVAVVTITCIIASNRIGTRRAAAMAAAYAIVEKNFEEYRTEITERIGRNKEQAARDGLNQKRMDANPMSQSSVIITGGGDVPCYDVYTGRYFKSDMETLKKAQNDLNYKILNHQYASLNDFYNSIGLPNIPQGEEVGWNSDKLMELFFSTTMTDDQRPAISFEFQVSPVRDYFRTHAR